MTRKRYVKLFVACLAGLLVLFETWQPPVVLARAARSGGWLDVVTRREDLAKIVSVLESKMEGRKLPEKARRKLLDLDDAQIRLMVSLAERIAAAGQTPGADIAFLLIAALLVLS